MKRALITGATGFVGQALTRRLVKDGWTVFALVRPNSRPADLSGTTPLIYDGATDSLLAACAKARPTVVFHLASLFIAEHAPEDAKPLVESNLLFGCQLLEAMTRTGARAFVNTGTSWQHYHRDGYRPVNLYAATKQAFEDILGYYERARGLRVVTLKLFDTYGPADPRPKLISTFLKSDGRRLAFSSGRQLIDIVHIDDVVEAFLLAADRLLRGKVKKAEVYAVSSGKAISLRQIAKAFEKASGKKLPIDWGARPYRSREIMKPWSKGRRLPGWTATISLDDGFRMLLRR